MTCQWLLVTTVLFSLHGAASRTAQMSDEKVLIKNILGNYTERGKMGRPVKRQNDSLLINYGLSLVQILDLDERNQILTTNVWANYGWNDMYLQWNVSDYDNITTIRVPKDSIWLPDIKLYNYADTRLEERRDALAVISHDGSVVWMPQAVFKSSCSIDIRHFPFDVQTCKLKFGSWTYDGSKLDLDFLYGTMGFEMTNYIASNEWDILDSSAKRNILYYTCCPEPYVDLTFTLKIRRKVAFYNYILILPCVLLSSLTLVLFWLPPESPAKMQLGMNIFVAFFVLLLLLAESTPPAASSIPLIGAYYCLNMILITLSTLLSVIVVNLYFRGSRTKVPECIKTVMVEFFARVFCMRNQLVDKAEDAQSSLSATSCVKGSREKKHSDFKYDRVGCFELQAEESWRGISNGTSILTPGTGESEGNHCSQFAALEAEVRDIRRHLKVMVDRTSDREQKERMAREWKVIALVLDRLFFFVYLIAIVASAFTIFETTMDKKDVE